MPDSFKLRLKTLVLNKKMVLAGAILTAIGVFLPWYSDMDKLSNGDTFFGITGPLYLAGLIVLLVAGISGGLVMLKLLNKPAPKLPMEENIFFVAGSALSVLMLILSISVYFHNKFGVNLTDKSVGIGMILDFAGNGLMMLGGILAMRAKDVDFNMEGRLEPLIDVDPMREFGGVSRQQGDVVLDRDKTVGEATKSWGQVQESISSIKDENTKDLQ
ncbi:hypothetical protein HYW82_04290 [Candidatus Peregrinibacteria bacterium]|nr:hypothetical protein [Candidatus Peregrinibacteria bacterium]